MVAVANTGVNVPALIIKFERPALFDGARVTVTVYVLVVVPSCAVTTVVMVFGPTFSVIGPEAVPELTAAPFTVIVAVASLAVGVNVIGDMP